jgi:hypothetical protein
MWAIGAVLPFYGHQFWPITSRVLTAAIAAMASTP